MTYLYLSYHVCTWTYPYPSPAILSQCWLKASWAHLRRASAIRLYGEGAKVLMESYGEVMGKLWHRRCDSVLALGDLPAANGIASFGWMAGSRQVAGSWRPACDSVITRHPTT